MKYSPPDYTSAVDMKRSISKRWAWKQIFGLAIFALFVSISAKAETFMVNSTADHDDGSCDVIVDCTLREAINAANANNNLPTVDLINFDISSGCTNRDPVDVGNKICTIDLTSSLPTIIESVHIDGSIAENRVGLPGSVKTPNDPATKRPGIELNGTANSDNPANGLLLSGANASNSIIEGLIVNRFASEGIVAEFTNSIKIIGNYVGTDATGTRVVCNSSDVCPSAQPPLPPFIRLFGMGKNGIIVVTGSNNQVGGLNTNERNVISGNQEAGVRLFNTANSSLLGNFLGADVTGINAIGNNFENGDVWAFLPFFPASVDNRVEYNMAIGSRQRAGIRLIGTGNANRNTTVVNNLLGVNLAGQPRGNTQGGLALNSNTSGAKVGFEMVDNSIVAKPNTIAYNNGPGISVSEQVGPNRTPVNNSLIFNEIYANEGSSTTTGLGIDLFQVVDNNFGGDGVTENDLKDADSGANNLQNYPVINYVKEWQGKVRIHGHLNSEANKRYRIDFYANDELDSSGHSEGQRYLGHIEIETNNGGNGVLETKNSNEFDIVINDKVFFGDFVTATATELIPDGNGDYSLGSTSEFSLAEEVRE